MCMHVNLQMKEKAHDIKIETKSIKNQSLLGYPYNHKVITIFWWYIYRHSGQARQMSTKDGQYLSR